mgnify:CR=1 FL=1
MDIVSGTIPLCWLEVYQLFKQWAKGPIDKRDKLFLTRNGEATYSVSSPRRYQDLTWAGLWINGEETKGPQENPYRLEERGNELFCNRTLLINVKSFFKRINYELHSHRVEYPFVSLGKSVIAELHVSKILTNKKGMNRSPVYGFYKGVQQYNDLFRCKSLNYLERVIKEYRKIFEYILQSQIDTWESHEKSSYVITDTDFGGTIRKDQTIHIKYCPLSGRNPGNKQYHRERLFLNTLVKSHKEKIPANILPYNLLRHCDLTHTDIDKKELKKAAGNIMIISWSNPHWSRWLGEQIAKLPNVTKVTSFSVFI